VRFPIGKFWPEFVEFLQNFKKNYLKVNIAGNSIILNLTWSFNLGIGTE
jgi:uncharacterized membrane protein YesL